MTLSRILATAGLLAVTMPVLAQDYGSMACEDLWYSRNALYKEAGYCFKTARAIQAFGNAGCLYDNMGAVPLSQAARREVADIQYWERRRGCPR